MEFAALSSIARSIQLEMGRGVSAGFLFTAGLVKVHTRMSGHFGLPLMALTNAARMGLITCCGVVLDFVGPLGCMTLQI